MNRLIAFSCPRCRSGLLRRRKRKTVKLFLGSLAGNWPYKCGACGADFIPPLRSPGIDPNSRRMSTPAEQPVVEIAGLEVIEAEAIVPNSGRGDSDTAAEISERL